VIGEVRLQWFGDFLSFRSSEVREAFSFLDFQGRSVRVAVLFLSSIIL